MSCIIIFSSLWLTFQLIISYYDFDKTTPSSYNMFVVWWMVCPAVW